MRTDARCASGRAGAAEATAGPVRPRAEAALALCLKAGIREVGARPAAARSLMTTVIAGEITEREPHDGYLVLQGGVPEVQEFLEKVWR